MTRFIIDRYNKFSSLDKSVSRYVFSDADGQKWAIKEFEYENGELMRPLWYDEKDGFNNYFYLHPTFDSAYQYVQQLRKINGW